MDTVLSVALFWLVFTGIEANITSIESEASSSLAPCVFKLFEKYFKNERDLTEHQPIIINLIEKTKTQEATLMQNTILKLLNNEQETAMSAQIKNYLKRHDPGPKIAEKAKNYLIILTEPDELYQNINLLQRLPSWNPLAKFVIFYTEAFIDFFEMDVITTSVFKTLFEFSILNVYAISKSLENENLFKTSIWFPFEGDSCATTLLNIRIIDECEAIEFYDEVTNDVHTTIQQKQHQSHSQSRLPETFHGCPLRVTTPIWEPYVMGDNTSVEQGFEILMLKTFAERLDLNLSFNVIDQSEVFARFTNDNPTGFYTDLTRRQTDVLIGGLFETSVSRQLLSSTIPYVSDDLTWCVAKAGFRPTWMNVFAIFEYYIWFGALSTILMASYVLFLCTRVENERRDNYFYAFLMTFSMTMGITAEYWPQKTRTRIFLMCILFYGINFSASYQSFLISVLTNPRYEAQVGDVKTAIAKNFKFIGPDSVHEFFADGGYVTDYLNEYYEACDVIDECLFRVKDDKKLAVALSRKHALNIPLEITEDDMFCFPKTNNIYTYSVVMLVMKDYFLLPKMNLMFRRMTETGFMLKWQTDAEVVKTAANSKIQRENSSNEKVKLNIDHLIGAFYILALALVFSGVVFCFEWIIFGLVRLNNYPHVQIVAKWIERKAFLNL